MAKKIVLVTLLAIASLFVVFAQPVPEGTLTYKTVGEGNSAYSVLESRGYIPYVFVPTIGSTNPDDIQTCLSVLETYGASEKILAGANAGIFYNWGYSADTQTVQYCFNIKEPEGINICNGVVLKSAESIDHTDCEALVIDASGNVGWVDYNADADALVAGTYYYYDMYGNMVDQRTDPEKYKIVSAVTGFVPILINGENQYDENDTLLHGYHNFVGHYTQSAVRIVFAANEDGYAILSGRWTLNEAAEVAKAEGYIFAYNLDGGGSSSLYVGEDTNGDGQLDYTDNYSANYSALRSSTRTVPTYIVFTAFNEAPQSATPAKLTATFDSSASYEAAKGFNLYSLCESLVVKEIFTNTNGETASSERQIYSKAALDGSTVNNAVYKAESADAKVKETIVQAGTPYYTKSHDVEVISKFAFPGQEPVVNVSDELASCLKANSNTRVSYEDLEGYTGTYYDYSTGYVLTSKDDLSTAGVKTINVYYDGMNTSFQVNLI